MDSHRHLRHIPSDLPNQVHGTQVLQVATVSVIFMLTILHSYNSDYQQMFIATLNSINKQRKEIL